MVVSVYGLYTETGNI